MSSDDAPPSAALAVAVTRRRAELVRMRLRVEGLLDEERRTVARADDVIFPLRSGPVDPSLGEIVSQELPRRPRLRPPILSIVAVARIPRNLRVDMPKRWERLGGVIVVRIPPSLWDYREEVGRAFGMALDATAVLAEVGGIRGMFREPRVERIWGESAETVHTENRVQFKFDPERIMFSSGNLRERIRMSTIPTPGETVVNLFSGIGYFALPMAVHSRAERIVACEVNPVAFDYLLENCRLNRASVVEPRRGDCRAVAPRGVADRVLLGYLDSASFLPVAFASLRKEGGWLHYHEAFRDATPEAPADRVRAAARAAGFRIAALDRRRLKSYGPRIGHWVIDARVSR